MKQFKKISDILSSNPLVIFSYLFGSRVKGYANKKSDWDIAVYFVRPSEEVSIWPAFELEAELSRALKENVQVTVLNDIDSPVFGFEIIKDGRLIVDKEPFLRMEFENRILRQYHDWQYFLKRHKEAERIG
jgi:predicted nucleotidyltransferase